MSVLSPGLHSDKFNQKSLHISPKNRQRLTNSRQIRDEQRLTNSRKSSWQCGRQSGNYGHRYFWCHIFDVRKFRKKNNSYRVLLNRQTQNVIPDKDGSARTTYLPIMRVSKSSQSCVARNLHTFQVLYCATLKTKIAPYFNATITVQSRQTHRNTAAGSTG